MGAIFKSSNFVISDYSKHWVKFYCWGILLIVLGLLAVYSSVVTTLVTVLAIGMLLFASGMVVILDTFTFWWRRKSGFFVHLIVGLLYAAVGLILIMNPQQASISLTLALAILYIVVGTFRTAFSASMQLPRWGWGVFSGLLTLILGVLILAQWPVSGLFVIGLFVGIDLIFLGWYYITAASASRLINKR